MRRNCIECNNFLEWDVFNHSMSEFSAPLCIDHQHRISNSGTTPEAFHLYLALKVRGVPAELEKFDGYKTIDIAVPEAKVNIEVDGAHHNFDNWQALSDLKRTYHSYMKGYLTLRIPNKLIHWNLEETANYIVDFLNESNYRKWEKW
jgi:hypothetical protein